MTTNRWDRVSALVAASLEIEGPERESFLSAECGDDLELRREVESLLGYENQSEVFLDRPAAGLAADALAEREALEAIELQVGPYELRKVLGAGGTGTVYMAHDPRLDRPVAVKTLSPTFFKHGDWVSLLQREARTASALNHPGILTIYESGEADGVHYIASEFVGGATLREQLDRGQLELSQVVDLASQMLAALSAAHAAGIVHRDIKPENLMVRDDGFLKILDFGLATWTDRLSVEEILTVRGNDEERAGVSNPVLGTVSYMSPEQARGEASDPRSDLFSVGVVLYEMICGRVPFTGSTAAEMASAIQREPVRVPSKHRPETPAELDRIVLKALSKDPAERFASAEEMLEALVGYAQPPTRRASAPLTALEEVSSSWRRVVVFGALVLALAAVIFSQRLKGSGVAEDQPAVLSVAVLPFENLTGEDELVYLAEGIAEDLRRTLSKRRDLSVHLKGQTKKAMIDVEKNGELPEAEAVGKHLSVAHVIHGRLRSMEDGYLLEVVQLDVETGAELRYSHERLLTGLVVAQRTLASQIADSLESDRSLEFPEKKASDAAQRAYLRGRYALEQRTEESIHQAIADFRMAQAESPDYAPNLASLAMAYSLLPIHSDVPGVAAGELALEIATAALDADPSLAEAHAAMGLVQRDHLWDWAEAEGRFRGAIHFGQETASAKQWLAETLVLVGNLEGEALELMREAHSEDPLSKIIQAEIGWVLFHRGELEESRDFLKGVRLVTRGFSRTDFFLSRTLEQLGEYNKSLEMLDSAMALGSEGALVRASRGYVLARAERTEEARLVLDELLDERRSDYVSPFSIALVFIGLEEFDAAFEWLDRAYDERDPILPNYLLDPQLALLDGDPRYESLKARVLGPEPPDDEGESEG